MIRIKSRKRATHFLSVFIGLVLMLGLWACGSGSNTDSDFESVDTSVPVDDWVLVWSDEFDGTSIDSSKWTHEVNCDGGGNQESQCFTDSADNSFVSNGILNIVARPAEEGAELPYTSARLNTKNQGDWKYGRFEMRAKLPQGQGTWPAFWMLPTDEVYGGWPKSGEIDIIEAVNLKTVNDAGIVESYVYGTLHYGKAWPDNSESGKAYLLPDNMNPADDFHTYAIEWQEGEIRWYVDGYLFETQRDSEVRFNSKGEAVGLLHRGWYAEFFDLVTGELEPHWEPAPFDQDFHLLLNLAVGGDWAGNVNDTGIDAAAFADGQAFEIDYVRVYECSINPDNGAGCETTRQGYNDEEDALVLGAAPIPAPPSTGIAENLTIFADAENPAWPLWNDNGDFEATIQTDDEAHGAVAEFTIGASPTVMGFNTSEAANPQGFDASPMLTTGSVSFDMKVVTAPNDTSVWWFKIESGGASGAAEIQLSASNEGQAPVVGEWQTYTFDLQTLEDAGLDLSNIDVVMIFPTWGASEGAVYRVDNVEISQPDGVVDSPELVMFEDAINPLWAPWDDSGNPITIQTDDAEHGATVEFGVGATPTVTGFTSREIHGTVGGAPFDASAIEQEGVFQFEMKVVSAPADSGSVWKFKIESNDAEQALELDLTDSNEGIAPVTGEWQTYTFSLQDLSDAGIDVTAIDVVMVFPAWGTGDGAVYRIDNAKIYNPNAGSGGGGTTAGLVIFEDTENPTWPLWGDNGDFAPTIQTDDEAHGAVTEFVIGASPTVMGFRTSISDNPQSFDATSILTTGKVSFDMKVVTSANVTSVWWFKIESGAASGAAEIELSASNEGQAPVVGEWQTYTFDLTTLEDAGLDLSDIDVVMIFPTWGASDGAVYRVDNVTIAAP